MKRILTSDDVLALVRRAADAAGLTVKLVDKNTDPLVELAQWDVSLPTE